MLYTGKARECLEVINTSGGREKNVNEQFQIEEMKRLAENQNDVSQNENGSATHLTTMMAGNCHYCPRGMEGGGPKRSKRTTPLATHFHLYTHG
jgi:hypothetical protein